MSRLEYYHGRPVVRVIENEDGEVWEWGIELAGGAVIRNKDKRRTHAPDKLEGTSLLLTTYSEAGTVLKFGTSNERGVNITNEVTMTPTHYTVNDPRYTKGEEISPQSVDSLEAEHLALGYSHGRARAAHDAALPDDPSAERTRTDEQVEAGAESDSDATDEDEADQ